MTTQATLETTFADLGVNEQIVANLAALGLTKPTPVQAEAIPTAARP